MNRIEICNAALRLLARNRIDAFTDNSAEARVMSDIYDAALGHVMTGAAWGPMKTTSIQLSPLAQESADGQERYALPADGWFAITRVFLSPSGEEWPYILEGNVLVVPVDVPADSGLYVTYTEPLDAGKLPGYMRSYLIFTLAAWAALPLTENNSLADRMEAQAERARTSAMYADAMSGGQKLLALESEYSMIAGR